MTVTAKTAESEMVIAMDLSEKDRASEYYYCRYCGNEMRLVLPKKMIVNHFRHINKGECKFSTESLQHIEAKQFFYNLYRDDGDYEDVSIEKIIDDRIGDVVLRSKSGGRNIVIEVQNSPISVDDIKARFKDWNDYGYSMLWVITEHVLDSRVNTPKWVKWLCSIYAGRVYMHLGGKLWSKARGGEWWREIKNYDVVHRRPAGFWAVIARFEGE